MQTQAAYHLRANDVERLGGSTMHPSRGRCSLEEVPVIPALLKLSFAILAKISDGHIAFNSLGSRS